VRVKGFCEGYHLSKENFDVLQRQFPDFRNYISTVARLRLENLMEKRGQEQGDDSVGAGLRGPKSNRWIAKPACAAADSGAGRVRRNSCDNLLGTDGQIFTPNVRPIHRRMMQRAANDAGGRSEDEARTLAKGGIDWWLHKCDTASRPSAFHPGANWSDDEEDDEEGTGGGRADKGSGGGGSSVEGSAGGKQEGATVSPSALPAPGSCGVDRADGTGSPGSTRPAGILVKDGKPRRSSASEAGAGTEEQRLSVGFDLSQTQTMGATSIMQGFMRPLEV
jgi:hypothetical protein